MPGRAACCPRPLAREGSSQTWAAPWEKMGWADNQMRNLYLTLFHMDSHKDVFLFKLRFVPMCSRRKLPAR